jgi:hypothetical protein
LLQILEAIRTDLIRSNPISLAFNTRRMVEETPAHRLNSFRLMRATANQAPIAGSQLSEHKPEAHHWMRSSVLDTSPESRSQ